MAQKCLDGLGTKDPMVWVPWTYWSEWHWRSMRWRKECMVTCLPWVWPSCQVTSATKVPDRFPFSRRRPRVLLKSYDRHKPQKQILTKTFPEVNCVIWAYYLTCSRSFDYSYVCQRRYAGRTNASVFMWSVATKYHCSKPHSVNQVSIILRLSKDLRCVHWTSCQLMRSRRYRAEILKIHYIALIFMTS